MPSTEKHIENILRAFEIEPKPLDRIVDEYYRRHREIGSKERHVISEKVFEAMRLLEYPDFLYERFIKWKGKKDAAALADALNKKSQIVIRANTLKTSRDELQKILSREGVATERTPSSPFGLIVEGRVNFRLLESFKNGLFEVQEEASQLAGLLVDPKSDEIILDMCAGAGGKTLLFAMLMNNRGKIFASDIDARKLKNLKERARQAGVFNIETIAAEQLENQLINKCDAVVIDAPCSGTGTLKRNPDLKKRLTEEALKLRISEQKKILGDAVPLVRVGGKIVYITCSVLPDENEEVAGWFVKKFPFEIIGDYFRTDPVTTPMDGFFGCVMKKKIVGQ